MFKTIITGRITKDLELKEVNENNVCNFTVATESYIGNKKHTSFVRCSVWGSQAKYIFNKAKKGQQVFLVGKASFQVFNGKDDVERMVLNVYVEDIEIGLTSKKIEDLENED